MAYQKLQGLRAVNVYPQDGVPVPNPANLKAQGTNTGINVGFLIDAGADFIATGVKAGDVVQNTTTKASAVVLQVVTATGIFLSVDIFTATPAGYSIYGATISDGPVLFVGTGGDVAVETMGGDIVVFANVGSGTFLPVMVKEVRSSATTATDILGIF